MAECGLTARACTENYTLAAPNLPIRRMYRAGFEGQSNVFPYMVPANCYFVMGDNRGNSLDSRYVGCIPRENIIGTPVMIYMSIDAPSEPGNPAKSRRAHSAYFERAGPSQRNSLAQAVSYILECAAIGSPRPHW